MIGRFSLLVVSVVLAGCASNKSLVVSQENSGFVEGVAYSLPKQLLKVDFQRSPLTVDKLLKDINATKVKVDGLKSDKSTKEKEIKELESFIKALAKSDPAYQSVFDKKSAELLVLKTELSDISKSLVAEKAKFEGLVRDYANFSADGSTVYDQSIKFTPQPVSPDPEFQYVAQINHQSNFSDEIEIKVKNGLLTGAIGHSEGKNDAIVSAIVGGISGLRNLPSFNKSYNFYGDIARHTPAGGCPDKLSVSRIIDPNNPAEVTAFENLMQGCAKLSISKEFGGAATKNDIGDSINGFVYRQPGYYKIEVEFIDATASKNVKRTDRVVLAQGPINYISLPKSGFAKNEYDITFADGALSKSKAVRPSEALAIASLLPNALKAIFAIPTELVQLKVDLSSKEQSLAETETAIVKALIELDEQQELLDDQLADEDE